jgi:hypothetical protein
MRKIILLTVAVLFIGCGMAHAQNKVVVIPMGSASTNEDNIYGGATILADGTVFSSFGKPFTVTHEGTGAFTLHMAGLLPGCTSWPMTLVSCWGAGFCSPMGIAIYCNSGDTNVFISTSDPSGTAADMYFTFLLLLPDDPLAPASASTPAKSREVCEFNTATGVETCR